MVARFDLWIFRNQSLWTTSIAGGKVVSLRFSIKNFINMSTQTDYNRFGNFYGHRGLIRRGTWSLPDPITGLNWLLVLITYHIESKCNFIWNVKTLRVMYLRTITDNRDLHQSVYDVWKSVFLWYIDKN